MLLRLGVAVRNRDLLSAAGLCGHRYGFMSGLGTAPG
jgi:hypothetical protein